MRVVAYRKGELTRKAVDRDWPYQVALPHLEVIEIFDAVEIFYSTLRSRSPRRAAVVKDGVIFNLYCFSEEADAEKFRVRFKGLKFDPTWRGKGDAESHWVGGK